MASVLQEETESRELLSRLLFWYFHPFIIMIHFLRISICEFHISVGCKQFSILQPDKVRIWDRGSCAAEDGAAPCWPGDRLWPLNKLWRGWTEEEDNEVLKRHLLCSLKCSSFILFNTSLLNFNQFSNKQSYADGLNVYLLGFFSDHMEASE